MDEMPKAYDTRESFDFVLVVEEKREKEVEWKKEAWDHKQRQEKRNYGWKKIIQC